MGAIAEFGKVDDAMTVTVNGHRSAPSLFRPFTVDVSDAVKPGRNALVVEVVNAPQNAMIAGTPKASRDKIPAGLVGPVVLRLEQPGTVTPDSLPPTKAAVGRTEPYTMNTPMGTQMADPHAREVLAKYLPDIVNGPQNAQAMAMSLSQLQPYIGDKLPMATLDKIGAELARLNAAP